MAERGGPERRLGQGHQAAGPAHVARTHRTPDGRQGGCDGGGGHSRTYTQLIMLMQEFKK